MDFFKYAQYASIFVSNKTWWIPYLVGGLCFLIVYVFQAVALYTIAKREGYKNKWMAFVPFFNTYFIGVCGQKNRNIRTVDTKTVALAAAILEMFLVAGFVTLYVGSAYVDPYWQPNGNTYTDMFGQTRDELSLIGVPQDLNWALWFVNIGVYILDIIELIYIFANILVLSSFFQTYATRRYFIFTLTSVLFPIQGILFFVVRNNKGKNYRDYIRSEQERQYRMYQQYTRQNFDGNPYNQNPYSRSSGNPPYDGQSTPPPQQNGQQSGYGAPEDPFSEFGNPNSRNDPFNGGDNKN